MDGTGKAEGTRLPVCKSRNRWLQTRIHSTHIFHVFHMTTHCVCIFCIPKRVSEKTIGRCELMLNALSALASCGFCITSQPIQCKGPLEGNLQQFPDHLLAQSGRGTHLTGPTYLWTAPRDTPYRSHTVCGPHNATAAYSCVFVALCPYVFKSHHQHAPNRLRHTR